MERQSVVVFAFGVVVEFGAGLGGAAVLVLALVFLEEEEEKGLV
jgi:hypothetical protein